MKRNQLILLEQSLQTDCDGLVTKLHGLVGNYDEISEKYEFILIIIIDIPQYLHHPLQLVRISNHYTIK